MKLKYKVMHFVLVAVALLSACGQAPEDDDNDDESTEACTPVKVVNLNKEDIFSSVTLNSSSVFLKRSSLKSTVVGYIKEAGVKLGEYVKKGQVIFTIQTKEAAAYKNLSPKDSTFNYSGMIHIKANSDGVVINLPHVAGDYVLEGEELCTIAEQNSLVFLLEMPYELHNSIAMNERCNIVLPDGRNIEGRIESKLSNMDPVSQTERYVIRPSSIENIPENLLATIQIVKSKKENAFTLPKEAVLTNETQTQYWVMKLANDSLAVKIPVQTGIRNENKIEILNPVFTTKDRFVSSGGYGLPDSALVKITR